MPADVEHQLVRLAEAVDRQAPAIPVDEIIGRSAVAFSMDTLAPGPRDGDSPVDGVPLIDLTSNQRWIGERDTTIQVAPMTRQRARGHRLALRVALAAAAVALVVGLGSVVRTGDDEMPGDMPLSTLPTAPTSTIPTSTVPATSPSTVPTDPPAPTAPSSGGMWPQSTLEEVRAAQEAADAGDDASTWQLDPTLIDEFVWIEETGELEYAVEQPGKLVDRFLREVLGWEAYMREPSAGTARNGDYIDLDDQRYLRCAPDRTNPLYPPGPDLERSRAVTGIWTQGELCAPTIDELTYESVSLDLTQPVRRGADGVWVVSRWSTAAPFSQRDPAVVEAEARKPVAEFLAARIEGAGAEALIDLGQHVDAVPLLYSTSAGARYERYEIERVDGPRWPGGGITFAVRLLADGDATVVEQEVFWWGGGVRMDRAATTENGQPILISTTSSDGDVLIEAPGTWSRWLPGKGAGSGGHEEALDVWFGALWRFEDFFGGGERIELVDPVAYDAWCGSKGGSPLLSGPTDVAGIVQQLLADPDFETTTPVTARIGGVDAVSVDVALAPGGTGCGVGVIDISRWIHGLRDTERLRLYLVDLPERMSAETLAITVVAPKERFDDLIAETAPIIESIEFRPG